MIDIKLIERAVAKYSEGDWAEYRKLFADDVVYEEVPLRLVARGIDDYLKTVERWKKPFPDMVGKIVGYVLGENDAAVEVEWTATQTGPLETPLGVIPPSNQRGTVKAMMLFKFREGLVSEFHHYFDVMTVLANIGALPMVGAAATKPAAAREIPTPH